MSDTSSWPGVCYHVEYDIPKDAQGRDVFENPSDQFHQIGVRTSKSVWLIPAIVFPWHTISAMESTGCTVFYAMYAESEKEALQARARRALDEHLRKLHTSLIQNLDRAVEQYEEAARKLEEEPTASEKERLKLTLYRERTCKGHLDNTREWLQSAMLAAELFDEQGHVEDLITALQETLSARLSAHAAEVQARRERFPDYKERTRKETGVRSLRWKGHGVTSLIRWMGKQGWDCPQAQAWLTTNGYELVDSTVKRQLYCGDKGIGDLPTLTPEQAEELTKFGA